MTEEPQPGVFVASLSTDDWEPDPDVGGMTHDLCDVPGVWAGFNRYDTAPAPIAWTPPQRETFMILEGAARIEIAGGTTLDLHAGSVASLPAGTATTWHITAPFREFWVLSGPAVEPEGSQVSHDPMPEHEPDPPAGQLIRAADLDLLDLKVTRDGGAVRYLEGGRYGVDTSIFTTQVTPGSGPATHAHPYAELFVLHEGTGRFVVDDSEIEAQAGDVVIVSAEAWHSFSNPGPTLLRLTAIHEAAAFSRVQAPGTDEP